jgi:hypothetical protein
MGRFSSYASWGLPALSAASQLTAEALCRIPGRARQASNRIVNAKVQAQTKAGYDDCARLTRFARLVRSAHSGKLPDSSVRRPERIGRVRVQGRGMPTAVAIRAAECRDLERLRRNSRSYAGGLTAGATRSSGASPQTRFCRRDRSPTGRGRRADRARFAALGRK